MVFDLDGDWPAAGFNLGFGKIVQFYDTNEVGNKRLGGSVLIDADGTPRPTSSRGRKNLANGRSEHSWRTTDGSLIDYVVRQSRIGSIFHAEAKYPNGMVVEYAGRDPIDFAREVFPSRIIDAVT